MMTTFHAGSMSAKPPRSLSVAIMVHSRIIDWKQYPHERAANVAGHLRPMGGHPQPAIVRLCEMPDPAGLSESATLRDVANRPKRGRSKAAIAWLKEFPAALISLVT
jgi:hypothetical protein